MAQCNYCVLKDIRAQAERKHLSVHVIQRRAKTGVSLFLPPGVDVFVTPSDVDKSIAADPKNRDRYFVAWLMELGERCEC